RFTLEKYVNQGLSYARGLVMAGYEVNRISLGFVCRDGKTDDDIWSLDFDYDPEQAQRVWDRLVALWDYLREGGDPEALNKHPFCKTCSVWCESRKHCSCLHGHHRRIGTHLGGGG